MNRFVDELVLNRKYTLAELASIDAPADVLLCFDGIDAIPGSCALLAYAVFCDVDVWSFADDDGMPNAELLRDALRESVEIAGGLFLITLPDDAAAGEMLSDV